ncbi:GNAT family N-acetyltransferase [Pararhodonellum marinum]|uniref:GNAT family N-acetyltransferase n=1 Tax=Pararhodonellum marinum TaxID=2755358 RepID=UPI00188FFFF9|nr:GNAT family N-acetyltransferase [Pararhodonellum marinum]
MNLLPIEIDESLNKRFWNEPECIEVLKAFEKFYQKVGFEKPWIGYFVTDQDNNILGCCGYKGRPKNGMIELSYGTFKKYEGKGIGIQICRLMVELSLKTDPAIRITARTMPDNLGSIGILKRNGFEFLGTVENEEDGEVLEWEFKGNEAGRKI